MSISRARSWPLLNTAGRGSYTAASVDDSFLKEKCYPTEISDNGDRNNIAAVQLDSSSRVQARRLLCRHYYPEGGWGWVVTFVGTLVHLLASGLQFSIPATVALPAKVKFYHHPWHTAVHAERRNIYIRKKCGMFYVTSLQRQLISDARNGDHNFISVSDE